MGSTPLSIDIDVRFNEASIVEGMRKLERAKAEVMKGTPGAVQELEKVFNSFAEGITKVSTRAGQAQERMLRNLERESKAYGMSQLDRLIQRKESLLKQYQGQEEAINRITAAMDREIAKEKEISGEGMKKIAAESKEAKNALALMGMEFGVHIPRQIRSFISEMPGVSSAIAGAFSAFAVVGLIEVVGRAITKVVEFHKTIDELQDKTIKYLIASSKVRSEFHETVLEAQIVNDKLEMSIQKLEKKPQNGMMLVVHETELETEKLNKALGETLDKFDQLQKKAPAGFFEAAMNLLGITKENPEFERRTLVLQADLSRVPEGGPKAREDFKKKLEEEQKFIQGLQHDYNLFLQFPSAGQRFAPDYQQQLDTFKATVTTMQLQMAEAAKTVPLKKTEQELKDAAQAQKLWNEAMVETNKLKLELDQAQARELYGMDKVNAKHKEMLDQLAQEEGKNKLIRAHHKENADIIEKIYQTDKQHEEERQRHAISTAGDEARRSVADAMARSQFAQFTERRKISGEEFGETDIQAEYQEQMRLAQQAFEDEGRHIAELRREKRADSDITNAEIKASEEFAKAADAADTHRKIEKAALIHKHEEEAKREAQATFDNARKLEDAQASEDQRRARDLLQRRLQMVQAQGITRADRPGVIAAEESLRIQAARLEYDQTAARLERQRQLNLTLPTDDAQTRIKKAEEITKVEEEGIKATGELQRQVDDAHYDRTKQTLEMQKQQTEEIIKALEPLYQTLFTHPGKFGEQLKNTLRDATLKPIVSGMSEATAKMLHPIIFGKEGQGGLSGIFGGIFGQKKGLSDVSVTPDGSMKVHIASVAPGAIGGGGGMMPAGTNIYSGGGLASLGIAAPPLATGYGGGPAWGGGGWARMGGLLMGGGGTAPTMFRGADGAVMRGAPAPVEMGTPGFGTGSFFPGGGTAELANAAPFGMQGGGGGGGGGVGGFLGSLLRSFGKRRPGGGGGGVDNQVSDDTTDDTPWGAYGGGGGGVDLSKGGGLAALGIAAPALSAPVGVWNTLKSGSTGFGNKWGTWAGGSFGSMRSTMSGTFSGYGSGQLSALAKGPAAGTPLGGMAGGVGISLAEAGLLGERRGTWGGVGEAAAGGFLVAGPIGAAVGAAIGLGEMAAGVESPRREAQRLVKQTYGISINNATADQIVDIANRSYAQHVSLAVRSPEVRHMLGLYAAGTGQASQFQQGAGEAHGASLVESGGRLQQQATYQYGQAYTYASNLPVYGGISPTQTLGTPGGNIPMQLSLNVGGTDAAKFMTGQVVTPDVISQQYASAMYSSSGRVGQSLMMSEPGAIVS